MGDPEGLWREARRLAICAPRRKGARPLPALFLLTDPGRLADPVAAAARLPRGAAVIHRGFGRPEAKAEAHALARVARARGLVLLIAQDAGLAAEVGAAGVHLPERWLHLAPRLHARRPGWLVTGAAHSARALALAVRAGMDAALVSPVFPSRSASAAGVRALGPVRLARLVAAAGLPVFALGGVEALTAARLRATGAAGLAAVEGLAGEGGAAQPSAFRSA